MQNLIAMLAALACSLAVGPERALATERPARPNVLLLVVDDLGMMDIACYGNDYHETPNIDALASSGVRFTDAYSASPVCSPTRAAIMTGRDPVAVNITDWIKGWRPDQINPLPRMTMPEDLDNLPLSEITIAEALRDRGYRTGFVGKWHLGYSGFYPEQQGFEVNHGGHHKGSPPGGYHAPWSNPKLPNRPGDSYLTSRLTDESIAFMQDDADDRPFFLCLAYYNVHTPIQPDRRHVERFRERAEDFPGGAESTLINPAYASMVHAVDLSVGRLIDALAASGELDNTVVIFTSDNGGLEPVRDQAPLRAGKAWLYEGGIRVPLIIAGPGIQSGLVEEQPSISMDLPVTLLDLTARHGDAPTPTFAHGISLAPLLSGQGQLADRALRWHYPHYHRQGWRTGGAIRSGDWKLIEIFETGATELYNLSDDPGEERDLSGSKPKIRDRLLRDLRTWRQHMNAKLPTPIDP